MTVKIRRAVLTDGPQLPALFEDALRLIASRFYSREQIDAWASRAARFRHVFETDFKARTAWVAEVETGRLLAYLDLEGGEHIDFFYARPEVTRTNITRNMYAALEAAARKEGVKRLTTEASEAAFRFFSKKGFIRTSKNDVIIDGVSIHNYSMAKDL